MTTEDDPKTPNTLSGQNTEDNNISKHGLLVRAAGCLILISINTVPLLDFLLPYHAAYICQCP